MDGLKFNTAISKLIELNNELTQWINAGNATPREIVEPMVQMIAPLCPHFGEELWRRLGHEDSITFVPFPAADPALLVSDTIELPVQINGKVRSRLIVSASASEQQVIDAVLADEKVRTATDGKQIVKTIVVPGRMVNIVIK
jgi:leucyl-tRNA synthetase